MSPRFALLLVGLLACKKDSTETPTPTKRSGDAADALWAMAPDKLSAGFVATPTAIATADTILDRLRYLAKDPELAALAVPLGQIATVLGGPEAHLADAGFSKDKGFAFFRTEEGEMFAILPLGDRDKLVKTMRGTRGAKPDDADTIEDLSCKPIQLGYACTQSSNLAKLDRLGKGKGSTKAALDKLGVRGDIEFVVAKSGLDQMKLEMTSAAAALTLDSGQVAFDAYAEGAPPASMAILAKADKPKPDTDNAAGFVVANLLPFLQNLPDIPLPGGTLPELAKTVKGPMTGALSVGAVELSTRVPLSDPKPLTALLEQCEVLIPEPMRAKQQTPGACRVVIPSVVPLEVDLWVENNELRMASNKTPKAGAAKIDVLTPTAKELATGGWSYALWGRGSLVSPTGMPFPPVTQEMPLQAKLMIRALVQLSELGVGVKIEDTGIRIHGLLRTIWGNPKDVAEKIAAITADDIFKNLAAPKIKAIADAAPTSPFATDVKAGQAGMMAPTMGIGVIAAVAVPAFMDYNKRGKRTEAEVMLMRISKSAKVYATTNAAFPVGETPITPAESCCKGPNGKCAPDAVTWATSPIWQQLDFAVDDPHLFRYAYKGTATEFTATATGDLDCDGIEIVYTLTGKIENGSPVTNLVPPSPNSD